MQSRLEVDAERANTLIVICTTQSAKGRLQFEKHLGEYLRIQSGFRNLNLDFQVDTNRVTDYDRKEARKLLTEREKLDLMIQDFPITQQLIDTFQLKNDLM